MKFRDGDELVRQYFRLRKRAGSPRGLAIAQRGRSYASACVNRKCAGRGRRIGQRDGQGELVQRCSSCGAAWHFSDVFALAGQSHSGRGGRPPRAVVDAGDLCRFVDRLVSTKSLEPGHAQAFLWYMGDDETRLPSGRTCDGSYALKGLADLLTEERYLGQRWHTRDVRRARDKSRAFLERDLARRGVLDR